MHTAQLIPQLLLCVRVPLYSLFLFLFLSLHNIDLRVVLQIYFFSYFFKNLSYVFIFQLLFFYIVRVADINFSVAHPTIGEVIISNDKPIKLSFSLVILIGI